MRIREDGFYARLRAREIEVGVVGMGYVGLPLALAFADAGFPVVGYDVDARRVEQLRAGQSPLRHLPAERIAKPLAQGRFSAEQGFERLPKADAVIVCVPTPLTAAREPDLGFVTSAARSIAERLRPGQLIVLESTTYPGTTEEVVRPLLERSGMRAGIDFFLAYSPEREDPGNSRFHTRTIPKLVGGVSPECLERAYRLYSEALEKVIPVSSTQVAELAKLLENIFRCVNIALVNELKMLCDRMGIDVWEVISAAATKPFGFMPFYPGPGLGGHCIPIDPFYLSWKAREYGFATRFIELAGEVNTGMPHYVVQRAAEALNERKKPLNGSRVLVFGVAYKRDVEDVRESPALEVMGLLKERGAEIAYHDPFVPRVRLHGAQGAELQSQPFSPELLHWADCSLILTDHGGVDYEALVRYSDLVVDTRNATREVKEGRERVVSA